MWRTVLRSAHLTGSLPLLPPDLGPGSRPRLTSSFFLPPVKRHRSSADTRCGRGDKALTPRQLPGWGARGSGVPALVMPPAGPRWPERGWAGTLPSQAWGRCAHTGLPPSPVHRMHPSSPHPRFSILPESREELYPEHLAFWHPECLHVSSPDISRLGEKALLSYMTCEPKPSFLFASKHFSFYITLKHKQINEK